MTSDVLSENVIEKGIDRIIKELKKRERGWVIFRIVIPILCVWLGAFFNSQFNKEKQLTIPTTVIDRTTGNTLHIEKPVPHKNYYEFPIVLHNGESTVRIDQYYFAKKLGVEFK